MAMCVRWPGAGAEMMGVSAQHNTIHVAIATWAWPAYFGEDAITRGIKLKTARWRRPAPDTAPVKAKCAGLYMICTLSKHEAEAEGCHDALMLDWRGAGLGGHGRQYLPRPGWRHSHADAG